VFKKCTIFVLSVIFLIVSQSGCIATGKSASKTQIAPSGLLKEYDVVVVQKFDIPGHVAAPKNVGSAIAEKVAFQLRRYSQKYHLFEEIEAGDTKINPAGKKVLIIKGNVTEYTKTSTGKRIGRSFIPGGEFTGTAAFAAQYQFVDKKTGKVLYETDLRSTSTGSADTVDYAMDRNAEAAAKVTYHQKTGK